MIASSGVHLPESAIRRVADEFEQVLAEDPGRMAVHAYFVAEYIVGSSHLQQFLVGLRRIASSVHVCHPFVEFVLFEMLHTRWRTAELPQQYLASVGRPTTPFQHC